MGPHAACGAPPPPMLAGHTDARALGRACSSWGVRAAVPAPTGGATTASAALEWVILGLTHLFRVSPSCASCCGLMLGTASNRNGPVHTEASSEFMCGGLCSPELT